MPKLPSADDFQRKVPTVSRHVSTYRPGGSQLGDITQGQAMKDIADMMEKEQEKLDDIRAEDAINQAKLRAAELANGEDGFAYKKGDAVVKEPIRGMYSERFGTEMDAIESGLSNQNQINKFRRRVQPLHASYQASLLGHIAKEVDDYADLTNETTFETERNNAMSNWANKKALAGAIERTKYTTETVIKRKGWTGDVAKAYRKQQLSNLHVDVIRTMATTHPEHAEKYYKDNIKNIEGEHHKELNALVVERTRLGKAQSITDSIMLQDVSRNEALKIARKEEDAETRKMAVKLVKERYQEKTVDYAEAYNDANVHLASNPSLDNFDEGKKKLLGVTQVNTLNAAARTRNAGPEPIQNWTIYSRFVEKLRLATMGDQDAVQWIKTIDIETFREDFDDAHYEKALNAKQAWIIGDKKRLDALNKENETFIGNTKAADTVINRMRDVTKNSARSEEDNLFAEWFYKNLQINAEVWHKQNPGVEMPGTVRDALISQLAQSVNVPGAGWSAWVDADIDPSDIDDKNLKEITAYLRKNRMPVTGHTIMTEYAKRFQAGIYTER